ncbi:MAG: plasmid partition protein ParA [Mycoplasmataceae bacterium RC_NB112A]|nr:MAG: plasmid partition protein ParA [Mycoplasmataceae bacterium RC_NB112A]
MTIIAFISQKGGVGKSTLARTVAVEVSHYKFKTLLVDCDPQQTTSYNWLQLRKKSKFEVKIFPTVQKALWEASKYDLLIIDGSARTSQATLEISQNSDLIIQPTGASRDDLVPAVKEFKEFSQSVGFSINGLQETLEEIEQKENEENLTNTQPSFTTKLTRSWQNLNFTPNLIRQWRNCGFSPQQT